MITIICITILAYLIMGKNIDSLLEKVKDVDWKEKGNDLYEKLKPYAKKAGRTAAKPLLQFYFVLSDDKTTTLDRVLIYAAIIYTVSPVSLIPFARLSALTSNKAKRSDNFYNVLTSREILHAKLKYIIK